MSDIDYGVEYTPLTVDAGTLSDAPRTLEDLGVKFVRIHWLDLCSQLSCHILPLPYFNKVLKSSRCGVALPKVVFTMVESIPAEGCSAEGDYLIVMDRSSLRLCGYAPEHASLFGFFQEKASIDGRLDVPLCPRTNLKRILKYAEEELGTQFLVGFETEFTLLKSTNPLVVVNNSGSCSTGAFQSGTAELKVLEEIAEALAKSGIELQNFHSEGATGQYELVTGPLTPLEAADALVHTRETVYNIAAKHGLRATLAPTMHIDGCSSGAQAHISVHSTKGRSPPSKTHPSLLTTVEYQFLAGLMAHLAATYIFMLPIPRCYDFVEEPSFFSLGGWASWGLDHRGVPVRIQHPTSPKARHFEVRLVDGTGSPYLVLASLLSAGIIGIRDKLTLEEECCGSRGTAQMNDHERIEKGITRKLPSDLEGARKALLEDRKFGEFMGEDVVKTYVAVNKTLEKVLEPEGEDEATKLARLVELY